MIRVRALAAAAVAVAAVALLAALTTSGGVNDAGATANHAPVSTPPTVSLVVEAGPAPAR
jgi:hypothetical protein